MISAIAATTSRIRVGSAGIMLPHYAPFKVAEQFRVLDALAPGRIDLGLGRPPDSDGQPFAAAVTWTCDEAVRRRSYDPLAEAFGHAEQDVVRAVAF